MKRLILLVLLVVEILLIGMILAPSAYALKCGDLVPVDSKSQRLGVFGRTEIEVANLGSEQIKGVAVGIAHISLLGKLIDDDAKIKWIYLEPGESTTIRLTYPIPKGTVQTQVFLGGLIGPENEVLNCIGE